MPRVGISLGSNLGDRLANLRSAVGALGEIRSSPHLLVSSIYETDPVGCPPGSGAFLNAVIEIETALLPLDLLRNTQTIESALGRPADHEWHAPRTVDLDLLYYDDLEWNEGPLVLPHPRMLERAFVFLPLAETRPDLVPAELDPGFLRDGMRRISEPLVTVLPDPNPGR